MSGSPKRAQVQLAAARAQQLARQREQRERERRHREEQERRARAERRRRQAADVLLGRIVETRGGLASLPVASANPLRGAADNAEREVRAIHDERSLSKAGKTVAKLESEAAEAAVVAAQRQRDQAARLAALRAELDRLPEQLVQLCDPEGRVATSRVMGELEGTLTAMDQSKFDAIFEEAATTVRSHLERVQARRAELEAAAAEATRKVADLEVRTESSERDAAGLPGVLEAANKARSAIGDAKAAISAWRLGDASSRLTLAEASVGELESVGTEATRRLDERSAIVESLRDGLGDLGFEIDSSSHVSNPAGTVGFRARHISGWGLALTVGAGDANRSSDEIKYVVEKSMREVGRADDGSVIQRCDTASDVLGEVHNRMREKGVDVGRLTWEGMPQDPAGATKPPPSSEEKSRVAGS